MITISALFVYVTSFTQKQQLASTLTYWQSNRPNPKNVGTFNLRLTAGLISPEHLHESMHNKQQKHTD